MQSPMAEKFKLFAGIVEKFVENNLIEKEQRDENLRKLAMAFQAFVKENPLRQGFTALNMNGPATKPVVKIKKLENFKGELPRYQSTLASGMDVRAQLDQPIELAPGQRALVPTGLAMAVPAGYEIQARPRSGWAIRDGMTLLNTPGTIDADYRGEIKIIVINLGEKTVTIQDQDRIAQLVIAPVIQPQFEVVDDLDATERGAGGFGSTGRG